MLIQIGCEMGNTSQVLNPGPEYQLNIEYTSDVQGFNHFNATRRCVQDRGVIYK